MIHQILMSAGFELRKYLSNSKQVLNNIEQSKDTEFSILNPTENETVKILGIIWNPHNDIIQIKVNLPNLDLL